MSDAIRQSKLFAAEDWKVVAQSFRNAEFKSYDFDTLRTVMLDIIQRNYPEDFNDYIQSSEFVALIDLVAFLGQNLSFRNDLNSREAFLDTAERRDSILKLARQLSYQPKRSRNAVGFLKIKSISSTENILDSLGNNLSRQEIFWSVTTDTDAYERFILVMNAAFATSNQFGAPETFTVSGGTTLAQYGINSTFTEYPALQYRADIDSVSTTFEAVSSTLKSDGTIEEQIPDIKGQYSLIYKNDGNGNLSPGTGFFLQFKQGQTIRYDYNVDVPLANRVIDLPASNVTENDIWVQSIDEQGNTLHMWYRVPSTNGSNVYLNDLGDKVMNIYEVLTGNNDQISIKFADGNFGNIPTGLLRIVVRTGNALSYTIKPTSMKSMVFGIPYMSKTNQPQVLTLVCDLDYAVTNAEKADSIEDIRTKAPAYYYAQDRMITGQDYASYPMTVSPGIMKIKSVNRTFSGFTRYMQDKDPTGTYNDLDIFGTDGFIYREDIVKRKEHQYPGGIDRLIDMVDDFEKNLMEQDVLDFYYKNYPQISYGSTAGSTLYFKVVGQGVDYCHGYYTQDGINPIRVAGASSGYYTRQLKQGSIVLFQDSSEKITGLRWTPQGPTYGSGLGLQDENGASTGLKSNGEGVVTLSKVVADQSKVLKLIPALVNSFTEAFKNTLVNLMKQYETFGIGYDHDKYAFRIINADNINLGNFSLAHAGDLSGAALDSSWLIYVSYEANKQVVRTRATNIIIGSQRKVRFYNENFSTDIDNTSVAYGTNDTITFVNNKLPNDDTKYLSKEKAFRLSNYFRYEDGYTDPTKVYATFLDNNDDRLPEDPDAYEVLVGNDTISLGWVTDPGTGLKFEVPVDPTVSVVNRVVSGRSGLRFQWHHRASRTQVIDPAPTNIVDVYVILQSYYDQYKAWIDSGATPATQPEIPTSNDLSIRFGMLNSQKSMSDEIIYHAGKLLNLFGPQADSMYRAQFKVVKMPGSRLSDNEIKSRILTAMDEYFAPTNWDFGETFYYTELAAYIHKKLTGNVASVVIVPTVEAARFGNLFQITPNEDEIFYHVATADNIDIISTITETNIRVNN